MLLVWQKIIPIGVGMIFYIPPLQLPIRKSRLQIRKEGFMDQEAKYWRDKWLESERVIAALRDLFTEGKPKKFEKVVKKKKKS